jgi:hypothetical protein
MIELYSKRFLLPLPDSTQRPVDLESLALDLDRAQREAGIHESWLTDHILAALCQFDTSIGIIDEQNPDKQINRMIMSMLVDAGFPDVATRFAEVRRIELNIPEPANRRPWNHERIRNVLVEHIGTSEGTAGRLALDIAERLQQLGFKRVGDALIIEIARHMLSDWSDREAVQIEQTRPGDGWLMPPGFWETFLPQAAAELMERGLLVIRPVSQLMPVVRLDFHLARFTEARNLLPVAELTLHPAIRQTCPVLVETLVKVREQVGKTHGADIANHPAHITVLGLDTLFANFAKSSAARAAAKDETRRILADNLSKSDNGLVVLRFEEE